MKWLTGCNGNMQSIFYFRHGEESKCNATVTVFFVVVVFLYYTLLFIPLFLLL